MLLKEQSLARGTRTRDVRCEDHLVAEFAIYVKGSPDPRNLVLEPLRSTFRARGAKCQGAGRES